MPIDYRIDRDVAIIGNLAGAMHESSPVDAGRDLDTLLDLGYHRFVFEMRGVGPSGPGALGVLVSLSRRVETRGGTVLLARVGRAFAEQLEELRLDAHWDTFKTVEEAILFFGPTLEAAGRPVPSK